MILVHWKRVDFLLNELDFKTKCGTVFPDKNVDISHFCKGPSFVHWAFFSVFFKFFLCAISACGKFGSVMG